MRIRLAEDTITTDDIRSLSDWLLTFPRLTKGALTEEFESKFAHYIGSKYAIYVSSGSSANLIAANALLSSGTLRNKTVIVPAVSWVTTVTPFVQLGYNVLMCDCDETNLGLNLDHFYSLCKEHEPGSAILVHVLGHDSSVNRVREICAQFGTILIEDTCEAIGSEVGGRKLGTFGAFGTYSFYFGHQVSSIEGGVLVTDDFKLSQLAKSMRAHGWARDLEPSYRKELEAAYSIDEFQSLYTFYYSGFNCRSTDLNAFLALRQIERLDQIVDKRHKNYERYQTNLNNFWSQTSDANRISSFAYGTLVRNRSEVAQALKVEGVETRPLICGSMARQPLFAGLADPQQLPFADKIHSSGMYLPNHLAISGGEIDFVSKIMNSVAIPA